MLVRNAITGLGGKLDLPEDRPAARPPLPAVLGVALPGLSGQCPVSPLPLSFIGSLTMGDAGTGGGLRLSGAAAREPVAAPRRSAAVRFKAILASVPRMQAASACRLPHDGASDIVRSGRLAPVGAAVRFDGVHWVVGSPCAGRQAAALIGG